MFHLHEILMLKRLFDRVPKAFENIKFAIAASSIRQFTYPLLSSLLQPGHWGSFTYVLIIKI